MQSYQPQININKINGGGGGLEGWVVSGVGWMVRVGGWMVRGGGGY